MRKQRLILLLLVPALIALPACSEGPKDSNVASMQTPTAPANEAFTKCMRENGAQPGGVSGGMEGGTGQGGDSNMSPEERLKQEEAMKKCRQFLPNGGNPQPMSTADLERMRALAKCMRDAGYNYPDPDPNVGGPGAIKLPDGVDFKDPTTLAKYRECASKAGIGAVNGSPGAPPGTN
ncbi:hypothetical protein [Allorhizocola rhizosphaerae]|uniref:hypothetical protein n=1 Tax=Allorhizocola rhizosphaerae TaxID=1872709 RepID=UPI0013C3170D|nr:hypothetical protein [Allorhizocola rhizosphaerae]